MAVATPQEKRIESQNTRWDKFRLLIREEFPDAFADLQQVNSPETWAAYLDKYPQYNFDPEVYAGPIKTPPASYHADTTPISAPAPLPGTEAATGIAFLPIGLLFAPKAQTYEDDRHYQNMVGKITKEQQKKWKEEQKKTKGEKVKEGDTRWVDFMHGSLDDPTAPSVHDRARIRFRSKYPDRAKKYDKKEAEIKKSDKKDRCVAETRAHVSHEYTDRLILLEKEWKEKKLKLTKKEKEEARNNLYKKVQEKHWDYYTAAHPEKVKAYAQQIEEQKKKEKNEKKKKEYDQIDIAQAQKRKEERDARNISTQQASERLDAIANPQPQTQPVTLVNPNQHVISTTQAPQIPQPIAPGQLPPAPPSFTPPILSSPAQTGLYTPNIRGTIPPQPIPSPTSPNLTPPPPVPQATLVSPTGKPLASVQQPTQPPHPFGLVDSRERPIPSTPSHPNQPPRSTAPAREEKKQHVSQHPSFRQLIRMFRRPPQPTAPQPTIRSSPSRFVRFPSSMGNVVNRGISSGIDNINNISSFTRTSGQFARIGANFGRFGMGMFGGGGAAAGTSAAATGAAGAAAGGTVTAASGAGAVVAAGGAGTAGVAATSPIWGTAAGIALIVLVVILILLLIIIIVIVLGCTLGFIPNCGEQPTETAPRTQSPIPGLTLALQGPTAIENSENISYTISVSYSGALDVTITDPLLPTNATFVSATGNYIPPTPTNEISWKLNDNSPAPSSTAGTAKEYSFTIVLKPNSPDSVVKNKVVARAQSALSGNIADILSGHNTPLSPKGIALTGQITGLLQQNPKNIEVYKQAEQITGVPWQILAGIHYVETGGGMGANKSLVSGRDIGANEPDIVRGGGCSSGNSDPGAPKPVPGGCGFTTLLESAIYAGNHLKQKTGGSINNIEEVAKALSMYNGGGNRNCFQYGDLFNPRTPWTGCPRQFVGEDDPYVFNNFDTRHENMYLVYCLDLTPCDPPRSFGDRLGSMSVAKVVADNF